MQTHGINTLNSDPQKKVNFSEKKEVITQISIEEVVSLDPG